MRGDGGVGTGGDRPRGCRAWGLVVRAPPADGTGTLVSVLLFVLVVQLLSLSPQSSCSFVEAVFTRRHEDGGGSPLPPGWGNSSSCCLADVEVAALRSGD